MPTFPDAKAITHAINWNRSQLQRAERDVLNQNLRVPRSAGRLSPDDYRAVRARDAVRFFANIQSLKGRL